MSNSIVKTEACHKAAFRDLVDTINKHAGELSSVEILGIMANIVGRLIALQDQRVMSGADALELVAKNIELGNKSIVDNLERTKGSA